MPRPPTRRQELSRLQEGRCASCRGAGGTLPWPTTKSPLALLCARCRPLGDLTVEELRDRALDVRTELRIVEAAAEWRIRYPRAL